MGERARTSPFTRKRDASGPDPPGLSFRARVHPYKGNEGVFVVCLSR